MNQSELALGPEPGPDVFDMGLLRDEVGTAAPNMPTGASALPEQNTKQPLAACIRTAHFVGIGIIAAGVWIVWPTSPHQKASHPLIPVSQAAQAEGSTMPPAQIASPVPIGPAEDGLSARAPIGRPETASVATNLPPTTSSIDTQVLDEQARQATALIESINAVNRRLLALEERVASLPKMKASTVPGSGKKSHPQARAGRVGSVKPAPDAPGNYRVNTIFRGQTWMADGEGVHVVQAGDKLGGMTVVKIDSAARTVLTDRGLIR